MSKLGRNELCHCGSGSKYKKCCIAKDEQAAREEREAAAAIGKGARVIGMEDLPLLIDKQMEWSVPLYAETAHQLIEALKHDYKADQIAMAIMVWHDFSTTTKPSYRKPGVICAALEYMLCEVHDLQTTQNELAEKYEVSAATLSKRFQEISAFLMKEATPESAEAVLVG
ncbi:SEC-C metal-binding domain-containing protein [Paenibacillus sp. NPDC058071]|uniref:SEC-C metal-binding domain-containing protein n=1 Tax=Paenibacillus sp. NPDC058071 TaxID=3346326 RepID=UPI0036DB9DDD